MSEYLPLFPLKLVVFPTEKIKLHIFEPRYKQLVGEVKENDTPFGIPPYLEGGVAQYGTKVRLINIFTEYEDGEMDILAEGVQAFSLDKFYKVGDGKLYPTGDVTLIENDPNPDPAIREELAEAFSQFHELLETGYHRDKFDLDNLSYQVAQEVGLTLAQKVRLLSLSSEAEREQLIIDHLHRVIPMLDGAQDTRKRVRGNGHFKKLPPINL